MNIVVFKILTVPYNPSYLSDCQKNELTRKKKDNVPINIFMSLNPNFSSIDYIYVNQFNYDSDTKELTEYNDCEEIQTFSEFVDFATNADTQKVLWVGWNCLRYDQTHIKFHCMKDSLEVQLRLFDTAKFKNYPVFDLMEHMYSWQHPSSLISTCDSFGIKVPETLLIGKYLEGMYENEDKIGLKNYIFEKGHILSELFKKVYKYYL